jgi:ariadne-1
MVVQDTHLKSCLICFQDELTTEDMISMPCDHEYCRGCWRRFVEVMIGDGPTCIRTTCPAPSCSELVTEDEVEQAAPDLLSKFESFQVRSFVELSSDSRWCPGPGCDRIAVCKHSISAHGVAVATCDKCSTRFCIRCGEEPHAPITCRDLAKWNIKCKDESETANWILANTKPCPKCSSRIEKNQGCNHMTCQQCKFEFCWICMSSWSEHDANTGGYYRCNKFVASDSNDVSDAAKAKRESDRYLHYYKRYSAHDQAEKFAKAQLRETEAKMALLQERSQVATWTDVEFLKVANEQLVECRRVLKYSYSFAYYLSNEQEKQMQRQRFEYHQEMLERFTEKLSELSEKSLATMNRTEVVNQTRVVDCFTKNILKYVEDGMEDINETMT